MKILLFGKTGQLGWELQRSLSLLGELVTLDRSAPSGWGDLSRPEGVAQAIREIRPDVIVNAAAYTAVDRAESEPDLALTVNGQAPAAMAREAQNLGAWMVHFSTDYVFDGSGERPWREVDRTGPLNVYGQTKLVGETGVAGSCERHLVLRTSWVFGRHGQNFAKTMLRLAGERERLTVIDDQMGAPTGADLIADATAHALRQALVEPRLAGIYHVVAAGETSWHGYAMRIFDEARRLNPSLAWKLREVAAVPSSGFVTPARRPNNSRLDTGRFRQTFGLVLPHWTHGVDRLLRDLQ
ncbi:MAG: dTDP-4-dehydrorhamnose reductase [Rhodoferax sp.]|nr:dTDP-4-dehydrorhamnose reductase [Rhodoferax sp.]